MKPDAQMAHSESADNMLDSYAFGQLGDGISRPFGDSSLYALRRVAWRGAFADEVTLSREFELHHCIA